jgi:hypothetical protein
MAYILWLPVCGSIAILFYFLGWRDLWLFRGLFAGCVLISIPLVLSAWKQIPRPKELSKWLWVPGILIGLQALFAAHPQRLYDQLNYHLVPAKRFFLEGDLFHNSFDPHVFMDGPVEFAYVWIRAILNSDLGMLSAGQTWMFFTALGGLYFVGALLCYEKNKWLPMIVMIGIFPFLMPNNEIFSTSKPDGLAGLSAAIFIALAYRFPQYRIWLFVALSLVFVPVKITYAHAVLAFGLLLLPQLKKDRLRGWHQWWPLLAFGILCCTALFVKNITLTNSLLYPADGSLFPSDVYGEVTHAYWRKNSYGNEGFFQRYLGPYFLWARRPGFIGVLVLVLGLVAYKWKTIPWSNLKFGLAFLGVFWLLWPFFFRSDIYARFVAPMSFGLGMIVFLFALNLKSINRTVLILISLIALAFSSTEVILTKLVVWNSGDAASAMTLQWPRVRTTHFLENKTDSTELIVVDDASKAFFNSGILHGIIGPKELNAWEEFKQAPKETALRYKVVALVKAASDEYNPHSFDSNLKGIDRLWSNLEPFGKVEKVGVDLVLFSECYFQKLPCQNEKGPSH